MNGHRINGLPKSNQNEVIKRISPSPSFKENKSLVEKFKRGVSLIPAHLAAVGSNVNVLNCLNDLGLSTDAVYSLLSANSMKRNRAGANP